MATPEEHTARLLKAREMRIDLEDGISVTVRRPAALEVLETRGVRGYLECAIGWSGFTEAVIFGEGSAEPIPFDEVLWLTVVVDRIAWVNKLVDVVSKEVKAKAKAQAASRKN